MSAAANAIFPPLAAVSAVYPETNTASIDELPDFIGHDNCRRAPFRWPFALQVRVRARERSKYRERERAGNGDAASPAGPREGEKVVALEPRKSRESRRPTAWRHVQRALSSSFSPRS